MSKDMTSCPKDGYLYEEGKACPMCIETAKSEKREADRKAQIEAHKNGTASH